MTSAMDMVEEESRETKKPAKEVLVVQDHGIFTHETGDTYDGFFEAKKKDRSIKMHGDSVRDKEQLPQRNRSKSNKKIQSPVHLGPGTYTTAEGDIYTGVWDANYISPTDDAMIVYKDGARYEGHIKEFSYTGNARYTYPDGCVLKANFVDNCPVGRLSLRDINGHMWEAKAKTGYAWFVARNHYYDMLETVPPQKSKRKAKIQDSDPVMRKGTSQKEVKITE